jgi:hypothetical protein
VQLGDLALGHGARADAEVGQVLMEGRHVRQVAGQAVERLRQNDVEEPLAGGL